ncbi:MAG: hypothetical protein MKZ67_12005, partial [Acidimicrobiales bacterium]|nr:hypothetical protein [Acidimicrobiales bacterium]
MARGWLSLVLLLRFGLLFRIGVFWCSALIPDGDGSANSGILVASEDTSDEAVGFIGDLCEGKAC